MIIFIYILSIIYVCQARKFVYNNDLKTCLVSVTYKNCKDYGYEPILNKDECQRASVSFLNRKITVYEVPSDMEWKNAPSCSHSYKIGIYNKRQENYVDDDYNSYPGEGSCKKHQECICKTTLNKCPEQHVYKDIKDIGDKIETTENIYNATEIFENANLTIQNTTYSDNNTEEVIPTLMASHPVPLHFPPGFHDKLRGQKPMFQSSGSIHSSGPRIVLKSTNEQHETWSWYKTYVKDNLARNIVDEQQGDYHVRPDCNYNNVDTWLNNLDGISEAFTKPVEKTFSIVPETIRGAYGQVVYVSGSWPYQFKWIDFTNVDNKLKFSTEVQYTDTQGNVRTCTLQASTNYLEELHNRNGFTYEWISTSANDLWDRFSHHQDGVYDWRRNPTPGSSIPWRTGEYRSSYKSNGWYWDTWFVAWDWYQSQNNCFHSDNTGTRLNVAVRFGWELFKVATDEQTRTLWMSQTVKNKEHLKSCFNPNIESLETPSGAIFQIQSDDSYLRMMKKSWGGQTWPPFRGFTDVSTNKPRKYNLLYLKLQNNFKSRLNNIDKNNQADTCKEKDPSKPWDWDQNSPMTETGGMWGYNYNRCICQNGHPIEHGTSYESCVDATLNEYIIWENHFLGKKYTLAGNSLQLTENPSNSKKPASISKFVIRQENNNVNGITFDWSTTAIIGLVKSSGLARSANNGYRYNDINFAIYFSNKYINIYESGKRKHWRRSRANTFSIIIGDDNKVRYYADNTIIYTSSMAFEYPYNVQASFIRNGQKVKNVKWVAAKTPSPPPPSPPPPSPPPPSPPPGMMR